MNKWVFAAILYMAVVIGGFTLYDKLVPEEKIAAAETGGHQHESASTGQGHGEESQHAEDSEVNVFVQAQKDAIKIYLKDKTGKPVRDLEVNHEKLLHFIIVDDRLQAYYHLHPEQVGDGEFRIANGLPDGFYKAFVDIKPKDLAYHVTPVPFIVGDPIQTAAGKALAPDRTLVQQVEGETVKLTMNSLRANEPVTLSFDLDQSKLTPYLGAMGHVVILDEHAQRFLHVHPANDKEPVFQTTFAQPGLYKIWAEFKQDGTVRAFPFVVEIK
ncbi:hypothetical protein ACTID9_02175 [Brevibacillus fluminis]|uniref:hypothetical protein n=1 Tax=Brevibacillus fluminis TaxID=511487 RepID=UPI003F89E6BF